MRHDTCPLGFDTPGSLLALDVFTFGSDDLSGPQAYLHAGLHANEVPGMLVLQYLLKALAEAESNGTLGGKVTVVPVANPIGLRQFVLGQHHGRFDLRTGENFNRRFVAFSDGVFQRLQSGQRKDTYGLPRAVWDTIGQVLDEVQPTTQIAALRVALTRLASGANIILDLHCDREACVHLYASEHQLEDAALLASYVEAEVVLHATVQGGASFDDNIVTQWFDLYQRLQLSLATVPVFAATIELRGRTDIERKIAEQDARRLFAYLTAKGVVNGTPAVATVAPPRIAPLSGVEVLHSPIAGLLLYHKAVGDDILSGDLVAEVVHPVTGDAHELRSSIDGYFFARDHERYVNAGHDISFIAGAVPLNRTRLLTD